MTHRSRVLIKTKNRKKPQHHSHPDARDDQFGQNRRPHQYRRGEQGPPEKVGIKHPRAHGAAYNDKSHVPHIQRQEHVLPHPKRKELRGAGREGRYSFDQNVGIFCQGSYAVDKNGGMSCSVSVELIKNRNGGGGVLSLCMAVVV